MGKALISLPGSRTKNKRAHDIPISKTALAILKRQPRRLGREFVFGEGNQGFQGFSKAKAALDARAKIRGLAIARHPPHGRNRAQSYRSPPHVVEAVVNHVSGSKAGVAGIYNKAVYAKEKVEAMKRWDASLARLVGRG